MGGALLKPPILYNKISTFIRNDIIDSKINVRDGYVVVYPNKILNMENGKKKMFLKENFMTKILCKDMEAIAYVSFRQKDRIERGEEISSAFHC